MAALLFLRVVVLGLAVSTQIGFVADSPKAANSRVTSNRSEPVADGAAQATLSVVVRATLDNAVGHANVVFKDRTDALRCTT